MTLGKKFGVTVYTVLIALIVVTVASSCVQMCNENIGPSIIILTWICRALRYTWGKYPGLQNRVIAKEGLSSSAPALISQNGNYEQILDLNEASIAYGQTATGLIELLVIIAGTCIALSILWAVVSDRLMLSRLSKLSRQVSDIGSKKDISNRIEINEKGGFSDLAKSFNRTLDALQSCEEQLKESEKRYRTIVEDQTEFIARFTADGTLTFVNSNLVKLIGLSPEQILGHSVHEVLPEYLHKQVQQDDQEISPGKPMVARENKIVLQNGSVRCFVWNIHGTFDEQGTLIELQAVGRDVTETREAEEALALANNKLNLMSSITRHDMMNQLTVAEGCISLIKMNKDPSRNNIYLSKAEEALIVMQRQLEFTRDYQSMGMNKPVWIDVRNVVKKAADNFSKGEVNISIQVDDYEIYADPKIRSRKPSIT